MFEDGTEMDWIAKFFGMVGAPEDGLIFATYDDDRAGIWSDHPIADHVHYICEKND